LTPTSILYVHQDGLITGSAISLRNLIAGLDRRRIAPRVLLAREGPARTLFESLEVPVDAIPIRGMWTAPGQPFPTPDHLRNWLALLPNREVFRFMAHHRPRLVHMNDKTPLPAGRAARALDIPVVWHLRSTYARSRSPLQARVSRAQIRRLATHLIAISEDECDGFDDLSNLSIVYNSLDFAQVDAAAAKRGALRAEFGFAPEAIVVGTSSTAVNERRGSWDVIRMAGLLRQRLGESVRLLVVGRLGVEAERTRAVAAECGVESQVVFTDFRDDALACLAAMDVVVSASRLGVLGRTPFEAMALARPLVVAQGQSGRSRVVVDGETALVVPPADPSALARAVEELLARPDRGQSLGARGREYARANFDSTTNAGRVMGIYDDVLAGAR
jgi:glycosyltransferase involved in cell wall biosynthesis